MMWSMDLEKCHCMISLFIKVNFMIKRYKVKENTIGQMVQLTKVIGKTTECMVKVFLPGLMETDILVNIFKTKSKALEAFIGLMGAFIRSMVLRQATWCRRIY